MQEKKNGIAEKLLCQTEEREKEHRTKNEGKEYYVDDGYEQDIYSN